jgi:type VI secretion system lysozyme-like protein
MQFLLERLAQPPSFNGEQQFDLRDAIQAQIQRLLSTRFVASGSDYGLLDFGTESVVELDANSKPQLEQYARRLVRLIGHYEPRLMAPRIVIEATGNASSPYRLAIYGTINHSNDADVFHFELPAHS